MKFPRRLRQRPSYADLTATLAVFVALGGTAYAAVALPSNSVGSRQIRAGAVRSTDIRDRSVQVRDLAKSTRSSLRGATGPPGPSGVTYRAAVNSGGGVTFGTARGVDHPGGSAQYNVDLRDDVSRCVYSATLAAVQNGPNLEQPPAGRITVQSAGGPNVLVRTYAADGTPADAPFHLLVAC